MVDVGEVLLAARDAHSRREWPRAFELSTAARDAAPLSPEDFDALSDVAWWLGRVDECLKAGEAAFRGYLDVDRSRDAAMIALGLAISLFLRGDEALGSGWIGRAHRLLEDLPEGAEHGYVRYVTEVEAGLESEDLDAVAVAAREIQQIGRRHGDPNLVAAGVLGEGRALVKLGEVSRGMRLLDEAMVAVLYEDLDPEWAGNIYCHLMAACHELADIRRAGEWTAATSKWLHRAR